MNAIFHVKTLRIDKNEDVYSETRRSFRQAVDTNLMRVRRDYTKHAENLDEKCAENYTTRLFSEALKTSFYSGGVHPVVFGVFGETNADSKRLIKICTKFAAVRDESIDVTSLNI